MQRVSSGLMISWQDFNEVLREEQTFHSRYCAAKKNVCIEVWLDRWFYCDSYVEVKHGHQDVHTSLLSTIVSYP
jgi:hypothetical protein